MQKDSAQAKISLKVIGGLLFFDSPCTLLTICLGCQMPHFINQLTVTGIELGCAVPSVRHVSEPYLDDRGFWLDVDVDYSGGFCLSLETKCNLMRLKYASSLPSSCINEESTVKLDRFVLVLTSVFPCCSFLLSQIYLFLDPETDFQAPRMLFLFLSKVLRHFHFETDHRRSLHTDWCQYP